MYSDLLQNIRCGPNDRANRPRIPILRPKSDRRRGAKQIQLGLRTFAGDNRKKIHIQLLRHGLTAWVIKHSVTCEEKSPDKLTCPPLPDAVKQRIFTAQEALSNRIN